MPDHHLLNGLFSHGGREKYPPAALNWVLAVPNLIHTYILTYTHTYIHTYSGCPEVSSSLYPNIRHNAVAKVIFQCIINKNEGTNHRMNKDPEPITNSKDLEIWWDRPITLPRKILHNRPDIVIWDKVSLTCTIIDISVPLDFNISSKIKDKQND